MWEEGLHGRKRAGCEQMYEDEEGMLASGCTRSYHPRSAAGLRAFPSEGLFSDGEDKGFK